VAVIQFFNAKFLYAWRRDFILDGNQTETVPPKWTVTFLYAWRRDFVLDSETGAPNC